MSFGTRTDTKALLFFFFFFFFPNFLVKIYIIWEKKKPQSFFFFFFFSFFPKHKIQQKGGLLLLLCWGVKRETHPHPSLRRTRPFAPVSDYHILLHVRMFCSTPMWML